MFLNKKYYILNHDETYKISNCTSLSADSKTSNEQLSARIVVEVSSSDQSKLITWSLFFKFYEKLKFECRKKTNLQPIHTQVVTVRCKSNHMKLDKDTIDLLGKLAVSDIIAIPLEEKIDSQLDKVLRQETEACNKLENQFEEIQKRGWNNVI